MRKKMLSGHRTCLLAGMLLLIAANVPSLAQPALPKGEQLRHNAAAYGMEFGMLAPFPSRLGFDRKEEQIVRYQASVATVQLTSANWPTARTVDFSAPRAQMEWLKNEGKKVSLHMLVGNHIFPEWFADGNWNRQQLDEHLEFWVRKVAEEFGNDIDSIVVVNEAVWDPAATGGNVWNFSGSFEKWWGMGVDNVRGTIPEFARRAFQLAREHFPANVKLIYNDYNHGNRNGKADAIFRFVQDLAALNVKPDVIGFESHYEIRNDGQVWCLDQGPSTIRMDVAAWGSNIDRYTALGVKSHITELDMQIPANTSGWRYEQARQLGRIADFAASRFDITSMTYWINYDKGDPKWVPDRYATLFSEDGRPKEAFYGVQLGLLGILQNQVYRISDDWTRNYVLVGSGNAGTHVVTHRSNPSWSLGKWTVRIGSEGAIRLENLQHSSRVIEADSNGQVRLESDRNAAAQSWRVWRGTSWDSISLVNENTGLHLNSVGAHDNAWLYVWIPNGLGNQNWRFQR